MARKRNNRRRKAARPKWYVVWDGRMPGVYTTWDRCKAQVHGRRQAKYKSFPTEEAANQAFLDGHHLHYGVKKRKDAIVPASAVESHTRPARAIVGDGSITARPVEIAICVDGAWSTATRDMEYRGVWLRDGSLAFQSPVIEAGTNNLAEFLGVVSALKLLHNAGSPAVVYTDSLTAMAWVRNRVVKSTAIQNGLVTDELKSEIDDAITWLCDHPKHSPVLKWETRLWGEIPADFGRK